MLSLRIFLVAGLVAGLAGLVQPAAGDVYEVILQGKVVMQDGSPPPKSVGIQRVCSDFLGSAPGPITNRKGEYLWRMEVDPLRTRVCHLEVNLPGYVSTSVDISGLSGYVNNIMKLPPLVLSPRAPDPMAIVNSESDVPSHERAAWRTAMMAIDAGNLPEAANQLQAVVQAAPKFARGWHTLGIVYQSQGKMAEARGAYEHATEVDSKMLVSYVELARVCILAKDWQAAAKAAETSIQIDVKRVYPESYLHQAVARYELKDLAGAEESAKEALDHKQARAAFVLGRIAAAKGDYDAARADIAKYLEMEPTAPDAEIIRAYLQLVGKPEGAGVDPDLERP